LPNRSDLSHPIFDPGDSQNPDTKSLFPIGLGLYVRNTEKAVMA
jgi:hypothetical protein